MNKETQESGQSRACTATSRRRPQGAGWARKPYSAPNCRVERLESLVRGATGSYPDEGARRRFP